MNPPRGPAKESRLQVRVSRLGLHVAFIALFAVLGGALRGFNLLVILAGLLMGLLLIQWRMCLRTLEGVHLQRQMPQDAVAQVPFQVRFFVRNRSRWLPTWLLAIDEPIEAVGRPGAVVSGNCGIAYLPANSTRETHYECVVSQRGRYQFGPATLSSGFPFGLIEARRPAAAPAGETLYVYPRLLPLRPGWRRILDSRTGGPAGTRSQSGPSEGDFYGLRDWQHGDSRRWIHWRTTARTDHPAVRQFEQQRRHEMCIVVDAASALDGSQGEVAVERAISLAATLITQLTASSGNRLTLAVAGREVRRMAVSSVPDSVRRALQLLAELQPVTAPPLSRALIEAVQGNEGRNRPVLIISPRPPSQERLITQLTRRTMPQQSPASLGHLDLRWLDIHSPAAQRMVIWETADATA